ncbi:MAG: AI-2E family transporter, partial [Anaerolineae bacterium]
EIWQLVEPELGAYIRSRLIQGLVVGALLFPGYWLLGSPYSALMALAGALTCLIPVVGAPLAVTTALLVGLLTGAQIGLFTALYALLVVTIVGVWLAPRLFGQRWNNPVLTTVLLIILASVFGLVGIVMAPPLSVVCQILWRRLVSHRRTTEPATQLSDLLDRQERVQASLQAFEELTPHVVLSSMERLRDLIERAGPILESTAPTAPAAARPLPAAVTGQETIDSRP